MAFFQKAVILIGMVLASLGACAQVDSSSPAPSPSAEAPFKVTEVVAVGSQNTEVDAAPKTEDEPAAKAEKESSIGRSVTELATETTLVTGKKIFGSLFLLVLAWLAVRLFKKLLETFSERSTKHRIAIKGLIPVVTILLWSLASYFVIVEVFSPPRETLIAGMASLGLALGFAAQDILKNIFAGIVILFDSPFKVGDKIEVGSHYGEVITIGLRSTKIITPDDSMVTIPNSEAMNTSVSNSNTGEAYCQVVSELFLPPHLDTVLVRTLAIEAAQVSKYIYLNKPIAVLFFNEVHDGVPFYKMRLKAYVMDIRSEFAFKSDMTELVMQQLFKEGILDKDYYLNHG